MFPYLKLLRIQSLHSRTFDRVFRVWSQGRNRSVTQLNASILLVQINVFPACSGRLLLGLIRMFRLL